jgi:hypothetical protein
MTYITLSSIIIQYQVPWYRYGRYIKKKVSNIFTQNQRGNTAYKQIH